LLEKQGKGDNDPEANNYFKSAAILKRKIQTIDLSMDIKAHSIY
jgi:hypothetical protein